MRRFWITILIVSSGLSTFAQNRKGKTPTSRPLTLSDAVEKVSASIVRVTAIFSYQVQGDNSQYQWISLGTGFIVNSHGDVATADHVVDVAHVQVDLQGQLKDAGKTLVPGSFHTQRLAVSALVPNTESDDQGNELYNIGRSSEATLSKQDAQFDVAVLSCKENLLVVGSGAIVNGKQLGERRTLPEFQSKAPRPGDPIAVTGFPGVRDNLTKSNVQIPGLTTNTGSVANATFKEGDHFLFI